jgi:hypothetical protein
VQVIASALHRASDQCRANILYQDQSVFLELETKKPIEWGHTSLKCIQPEEIKCLRELRIHENQMLVRTYRSIKYYSKVVKVQAC